ncbi:MULTISPECIES: hypothetical protein [Arthrobacter]|uniref:Uncharacterized protein n=1 Tax=Arthrobacter caoxuetaonis TaxID=2886935 RepID=A0A9X1MD61_9MICC|nr:MULTISPECIES: hypothetical protein [Arthrobacter]MCC3282402.1 hypothetical protein [Arthrobacter caoxuetaonis]MCC3297212.1 hypothetical protein [Arthrobacter caoxuetaonis]MCC9194100.1 hypothetical protein [Arthrobacter sp. zg-Y916]USQ58231.1 hypothetical protein NF551_05180 [Arthrobacter caoxuetaonis]
MSTTLSRREWRRERSRQQRFTRISYSAIGALVLAAMIVFAVAVTQ